MRPAYVGLTALEALGPYLCVWVVTSPVWPDAGLPTEIPYLELDVFICDSLHIEANRFVTEKKSSATCFRAITATHILGMVDITSPTCFDSKSSHELSV